LNKKTTTAEWAWQATHALPEGSPAAIVASWGRCAEHGLRADATPELRSVDPDDLRARLRANEALVEVASRHLRWLSRLLGRIRHVAYVVDRDGVVLFSAGDREITDAAGLHPGNEWSEALMGTNGAGTALVAGRPVAVLGCEHYVRAWQGASCLAAPIHDADGRVVGAVDLTTAAEDCDPELLGLVAHAALTIGHELTARQLDPERKAREAAERKQSDREQLLATVAHDLRGPNSVVSLAADMLPTSEIESARARIKRATSRIDHLVRDLLDFSKVTDGHFAVVRERGDLCRAIADVVELFQPLAGAREIALAFAAPRDAPMMVPFDAAQVGRAISNIIQNALKFTPAGGRVVVGLEPGTTEVLVTVTDNGPGFSSEDLGRMFEPYWSGRLRSDSTGLGLAIASGIVKAHGGRISAENLPGGGARFVIALPVGP
jgi:signal transduction histidine kinase